MANANPNPARLNDELDRILDGVMQFGSALNAMDHGGPVADLEESGHQMIRTAFERAAELNELLPRLAAKLNAGESVADEGFDIRRDVEAVREQIARTAAAGQDRTG